MNGNADPEILQGITQVTEGVEVFLQEEDWVPLSRDLTTILQQPSSDSALGIEIVRVLLVVLESDSSPEPREGWMPLITLAKDHLTATTKSSALELPIAVAQLAVELLAQSPRGPRKRYQSQAQMLLETAETLLTKEDLGGDDRDGLEEVVNGLSALELP